MEPVECAVVDGFSDIEAEIEARVIAASEDDHELVFFVLGLPDSHFGVFPFEDVGTDEGGFVP